MRTWWVVGGLVLVLALTGLGVGVAWRSEDRACGAAVTSYAAADSRSPFVDPAPAAPALVEAVAAYGEVVGAYGYDYEPPQVTSYATGLGVRLRDDNRFTMLDDTTLAPRWSVAVGTRSSTFDSSEELYVVVTLPEDAAPEVVALDLGTGERRWCTSLGGDPVTDEPVSTRVLDDGSTLVLVGGRSPRLARVGTDGVAWEEAPGAGDDFVGLAPDGSVLVGGSPLTDLLDPAALAAVPAGERLAAHDPGSGRQRWSVEEPRGTDVHVLGTTSDRILLTRVRAGSGDPELVALEPEGREVWATSPAEGTAFDATVRGDRVLVRAGSTWTAYDAGDGNELWRFSVRASPQFLPYGATLDALPSLDADTLLIGATDALVTLDLRDGSRSPVPLPTDGVATTYWPVALAASPAAVAVVTNVATVVVRR